MASRREFLISMGGGLAAGLPWARPAAAQQAIRIGELAAITGPIAPYGTQLKNARMMAIDEINARGGISIGGAPPKPGVVSPARGEAGGGVEGLPAPGTGGKGQKGARGRLFP